MTTSMENYNFSCDTLHKIKLSENRYGELLFQFQHSINWSINLFVLTLWLKEITKFNENIKSKNKLLEY